MRYLLLFLILLILPSVNAFSCSDLDGEEREYCEEIKQMDIPQEEQDYLIASLFDLAFEDIFDYNKDINFNEAPDDVETEDEGYIKDAWVKIISISTGILIDDTIFIDDSGKILTRFNYEIELPDGTEGSDCKTKYSVVDEDSDLNIYKNNNLIGHNEITNFNIYSNENQFKSRLKVRLRTKVKHYRWDDGDCEYHHKEYRTHTLYSYDYVNTERLNEDFNFDFKIIKKYLDTTKGILKAENFKNLELEFEDSSYTYNRFLTELDYSLLPYYALTLKGIQQDSEVSNNIFIERDDEIKFSVKNTDDCRITISSFFEDYEYDCDLSYEEKEIDIETDKIIYDENEIIKVFIDSSEEVEVTYGDETQYSENYVEFFAKSNVNKITAESGYIEDYEIINVKSKKNKGVLFSLGIFVSINYLILKVFKVKCA
jgi:hypothetical protein